MEKDLDIVLIERYLNNEITTTEKEAFDLRLQKEEILKAEFQRRQTAHNALDFIITSNFKKQLERLESESETGTIKKMNIRRISILSIAASIAILVGAFYLFSLQDTAKGVQLAASYYEIPNLNNLRNGIGETANENLLSRGLTALQNQEYNAAIKSLDSIQSNAPFYLEAQYYQAHAYYLSDQFKKAESAFEAISTTIDIRYSEEAEWFALLSCLTQESTCEEKLNRLLKNSDHTYHKQALEIREKSK